MTFTLEDANIIIEQLGGFGKLKAMVAAQQYYIDDENSSVGFKFKGSEIANVVDIKLTALDLYDITFKKIQRFEVTIVKQFKGMFAEDLIPTFEDFTGLYLSL